MTQHFVTIGLSDIERGIMMNVTVVSNGQRSLLEALRQQHHLDGASVQYVTCHPGKEATDGMLVWPDGQFLHEVAGLDLTRWLVLFHCGRCLTADEIRSFPAVIQIFPGPHEFFHADLDGLGVQAAVLRYLELSHQNSGYTCVTVFRHTVSETGQIITLPISEVWVPVFASVVDPEELLDELWSREVLELIHLRCGRTQLTPLPASRARPVNFTWAHGLEVSLAFGREFAAQLQAD